jgi:acyl-CoA thioesterase
MQRLDEGEVCATIQITMNFLKPVRDGTVECIATVMNRGKKIVNVRGELYVRDRLIGTADGNFAVMRPAVSALNQA